MATAAAAPRVVIAEDEAIIRLDLRETLEAQGYEVVGEAGRGDEGLAQVQPDNRLVLGDHDAGRRRGRGHRERRATA